jgi:Domain of unknown function (DUF4062)
MSYKGTLPVDSRKSAFANCLDAVAKCDHFLGLITPYYGSGREAGGVSITHRELLRAIELDKPRWILAHAHGPFARQILRQYRFKKDGGLRKGFRFAKTAVLDGICAVEMYEADIRTDVRLAERTGNWVQEFFRFEDALQYISAQLGDVQRIRDLLRHGEQPS